MDPFRFDCSSLVSRAYYQGAGIPVAGETWAPSTRNMMPWDGVPLSPWYAFVSPDNVRPGDLALSRTCTKAPCLYQHVGMILPFGLVVQTNSCGDVAHVTDFYGFTDPSFVVARRVMLGGDQGPEITLPFASDATDQLAFVPDPVIPTSPSPAPSKPSGKPAAPSTSPSPATPSPEGTPSPEATPAPEATPGADATTPPTPEASSEPSSPDQAAPPPASPSS